MRCVAPPFTNIPIKRIKVNNAVSKYIKVNKGGVPRHTHLNVAQIDNLLYRRMAFGGV